jgi:amphi-Trp domain-containing protein
MAKNQLLIVSKEHKDAQSAAAFLHQLADKVASRQVTLSKGDDSADLQLPENVVLSVKAKEKPGKKRTKQTISIRLSWVEGEESASGVEVS